MTDHEQKHGGQHSADPGAKRPSGEMVAVNRTLATHQADVQSTQWAPVTDGAVRLVEIAHTHDPEALIELAVQSASFRDVARQVVMKHAALLGVVEVRKP